MALQNEFKVVIGGDDKPLQDAISRSQKSLSALVLGFGVGIGESVFENVSHAVKELISGSVEEFEKAERTVESLRQSLEAIGRIDVFDRVVASSKELQKQFEFVGTNDIEEAFQRLIQLGGLTESQIQRLIPVIVDLNAKQRLSGAVNKTLASSAEDVAKAISGGGRELRKYGIELGTSNTHGENLAIILDKLPEKVKGAAAAFGNSLEGRLAATTTKVHELQEALGSKLLPMKASLLNFAVSVGNAFEKFYQKLTGTLDAVNKAKNDLANIDESKKKAKSFAENAAEFLKTADEGNFNKFVNFYENKIDELSGILAAKLSAAPGSSVDDFPVLKKQIQLNRDLADAIREQRRLQTDSRQLGDVVEPDKVEKADQKLKALKKSLQDVRAQLAVVAELRKEGILPKFREEDANKLELRVLDLLQDIDKREVEIKLKPKLEIDPQLNDFQIQKIEKEGNERLSFTKMQAPLSLVIDEKLFISSAQATANAALKKIGIKAALNPAIAIPFGKTNELLKKAGLDQIEVPITSITLPPEGIKISGGVERIVKNAQAKIQTILEKTQFDKEVDLIAPSLGISSEEFEQLVAQFESAGHSSAEAFNKAVAVTLGDNLRKTLASAIDTAFVGLGDSLATIFNGGGLAAAAEGFLDIIGTVLQEVGKQIIVASTLVIALKKALATLFATPQVPLGIGIALVALGGILKNIKLDKPRKFAEGAIALGPTPALIGESGPEMVVPLSRANQFTSQSSWAGNVVFEIEGKKLRGVLQRTDDSIGRMGG